MCNTEHTASTIETQALYQEADTRRIISFASAEFSESEAKWHSNKQECYALVRAIEKYRPYLEAHREMCQSADHTLPIETRHRAQENQS